MFLSYSTGSYVDYNFYTKTETDTLLADKVINIGDISLPGMLDIGTSGYTNARIRRNAELNGCTGYAELRAAPSYDKYVDLSTTGTDGGWMYFKINNDDYIQLSGSDSKGNIYKVTTINGTLGVQGLSVTNTSARPIETNNTMHNGPYLVATSQNYNNNVLLFALRCRPLNQLWCFGVTTSNQYIISHENSTKLSIQSNGNTTIRGNLDVGPSQSVTSVKAYVNHARHQGNVGIEARWNSQGFIHFNTTSPEGLLLIATKDDLYLYCGLNIIYFYKPTTNPSDDRLKGNEELIENACETLSELRPQ